MSRKTASSLILAIVMTTTGQASLASEARAPAIENMLRRTVPIAGAENQRFKLADRMAHYRVPGVSIAVIENCRIVNARGFTTKQRTTEIMNFYREKLAEYSIELDVTLEQGRAQSIQTIQAARGSEGPRGLLAYYYAFLQTRARYNPSTSFPIVIDAPNQQGQDELHLPEIVKFLFVRAPAGSQVIVAAEEAGSNLPEGVEVHSYGERKRQVLRDSEFEDIKQRFAVYTNQMIAD